MDWKTAFLSCLVSGSICILVPTCATSMAADLEPKGGPKSRAESPLSVAHETGDSKLASLQSDIRLQVVRKLKRYCSTCIYTIYLDDSPTPLHPEALNYIRESAWRGGSLLLQGESGRWIKARVKTEMAIPVTNHLIRAGEALHPFDIRLVVREIPMTPQFYEQAGDLYDTQTRRDLMPNQPIGLQELTKKLSVKAGQTVRVISSNGGVEITGEMVSMDAGAIGDQIRLRTQGPLSLPVITGIIESQDTVRLR